MKCFAKFEGIKKIKEFNDELYIIYRKKDDMSTLIRKKDGSFVYPDIWYKAWEDFNDELYIICDEDANCTLIKKKDGSFLFDNSIWLQKKSFVKLKNNSFYIIKNDVLYLYN